MAHESTAGTPCSWPSGCGLTTPNDLFWRPIAGRPEHEAMSFSSYLRRFVERRAQRRGKPGSRRWRPLVEVLEDRRLLATLTVNSFQDFVAHDDFLTLREALLLADDTLSQLTLTTKERDQISGDPAFGQSDTIRF